MLRSSLFLAFTLLLGGCVALHDHPRNTGLVQELGVAKAQEELAKLTSSALEPTVVSFVHTPTGFELKVKTFIPETGRAVTPTQTVDYAEVHKVEVFKNKRVLIRDADGRRRARFRFKTLEQCDRWADLVLSLKAEGGAKK